ncbi:MAG: 2OG-Fe(II) oxygenase [Acidimicrobiales bacterium]|jgi:isopenicillin N synthase-like dioxygenase|nr:2OG-Fe(II) oxygenase [Acidimicrobiales bacterium]
MVQGVPVVDLSTEAAGADLVESLETASSAIVVGHGIDLRLRSEVIARSREFFALPREVKERVRWPGTGPWFGWQPVNEGAAELTGTRVPDLVERFEVQEIEGFTYWPDEVAGFREAWLAYYFSCATLASRLVRMVAAELDLPEEELPAWTERQFANLVANHYVPQPEPPLPGQTRVGPHTDRGGVTLLAADEAPGGLEVRLGGREWVPVVIPSDAYVLQVGDLFARWTNKRLPANVHRVVNPPREVAATSSRLALVYFHYPALDAVVTPAPSCVTADRPALPSLVCGDHLLARQEAYKTRGDDEKYVFA